MSQENYQYYSLDPRPQIHQAAFFVDKNRKYLFDVNQNIKIKKLKQMIVAAADLNKAGLRIFHDGKEYTDYDESALDELFPDLTYVEFYIQYSYEQIEDLEEIIDLKLQQHCLEHDDKYPYFYCFTCGKSICNKCMLSGAHNGHETKEKYDYLLASKNLVEVLFKDLKDILKNTKEGSNDTIDALKAKVEIQFFPKLVELVKKIENNMMKLILFYLEKEKGNYHTIENNVKLLKSHCEEGLDKLKEEIVIEDIMLDEDVFLTFDSKFKEIGKEKEKFKEDIDKYKQFSDNINLIQSVIEKTYNEIYNFLIKYLTVTEFENLKNQINSQNINVIDKKRILNTLLSNVKKNRPNSEKKYIRSSDKYHMNNNMSNDRNIDRSNNINLNNNNNTNASGYYLRSKNNNLGNNNLNNLNNANNNNTNVNVNLFSNKFNSNNKKDDMEVDNDNNDNNNVNIAYNISNKNNNNNHAITNKRYNLRNIRPNNHSENYIEIDDDNDNENNDNTENNNYIQENNDINIKNNNQNNSNIIINKNNLNNNIISENNKNQEMNMNIPESGYTFDNMGSNIFKEKHNVNNNPRQDNNINNIHHHHQIEKNVHQNINNNINITNKSNSEEEEEVISNSPIYNIICNIIPSKSQIVLYNVDQDCIMRKSISFSPLLGVNQFLPDCAWVNNNNKLYILGGIYNNAITSKIFLEYDPIKDKMKRLPDSLFPHSKHSLFAYNNQIYAVGGDKFECEKFDINNNEWTALPNLSFKQIYPVLYVHNDILYSFFGIDENIKKSDNIQKLNLKNPKAKWQKVNYKRNKCNLNLYGCGIAKINENCVLFLGGMDDNGIRDDAIQFDFSTLTAKKTDFLLEEKAYFKDSILLKLSQKDFGNFSIEDNNPFLKINFQVNVKKLTN